MNSIKKIWFNGFEYEIQEDVPLTKLISYFNYQSSFIVEYNFLICNENFWDQISIKNGDKIEIITLVGGG